MTTEKPFEIVPDVYGLGSPWVNWYLVREGDSLTAVDAGLPGFAADLEKDFAALGLSLADVKAVVLTHSDADHTGVTLQLREAGARVLIHADDEQTLAHPGPKKGDASPRHLLPHLFNRNLWRLLMHIGKQGGAKPPKVEGAETFTEGDVLDVPGHPRVVHMPGHTPGHSALLFEQHGALFVGDGLCTTNGLTGRQRAAGDGLADERQHRSVLSVAGGDRGAARAGRAGGPRRALPRRSRCGGRAGASGWTKLS